MRREYIAQTLFSRSVPLFFIRLNQGFNDLLRFPQWYVGLKLVNAFLNVFLLFGRQIEKFYSCAAPGAELFAPDQNPAFVSAYPILEPDKALFELGIRFDPDSFAAEIDELSNVGLPFEMFERYDPQAAVPVLEYRLARRCSHGIH
jgi:hypothetical protein